MPPVFQKTQVAKSAKENAKGRKADQMFEERDGIVLRDEPGDEVNRVSKLVVGAAIEVHTHLGPSHLESVYEEALCIELALREISFERPFPVTLLYKGHGVGENRPDSLVAGLLVVELKSCEAILPLHRAKVISYLRATGKQLGLILNFNAPMLKDGIKRIVQTR